jgi:hypothetical protein
LVSLVEARSDWVITFYTFSHFFTLLRIPNGLKHFKAGKVCGNSVGRQKRLRTGNDAKAEDFAAEPWLGKESTG